LYKFSALWSGQQGSLLFWSFLLSITSFPRYFVSRQASELMPYVGVVLASVQLFFLTLNNFVASPFAVLALPGAAGAASGFPGGRAWAESLAPVSGDGDSSAGAVFGYTGFTIPFAFAMAALIGRYPGENGFTLRASGR